MKMKFYHKLNKSGKIRRGGFCKIINVDNYDVYYSEYLANSVFEFDFIREIDEILSGIQEVENEIIECYDTVTDIFSVYVYKDRVEFEYHWEDEEWPNWSCTVDEYKRVLLGQKAFLMLPRELESYLEIKINDIE